MVSYLEMQIYVQPWATPNTWHLTMMYYVRADLQVDRRLLVYQKNLEYKIDSDWIFIGTCNQISLQKQIEFPKNVSCIETQHGPALVQIEVKQTSFLG